LTGRGIDGICAHGNGTLCGNYDFWLQTAAELRTQVLSIKAPALSLRSIRFGLNSCHRWCRSQAAMLCAMTICALFLFAAQVSSKQTPAEPPLRPIDPSFALKNPNAFDPARRRSVRALTLPRESAGLLASGIDAAEAQAQPDDADENVTPTGRLSLNAP
jgi:hypothetical protein